MSYEKFAPMTSALLARKGEAAPSLVAGQRVPREIETGTRKGKIRAPKQTEVPARSQKKASSKRRTKRSAPRPAATKRRVVLTLTKEEFERVETAAGKRKNTPQQLARDALFVYLSAITL